MYQPHCGNVYSSEGFTRTGTNFALSALVVVIGVAFKGATKRSTTHIHKSTTSIIILIHCRKVSSIVPAAVVWLLLLLCVWSIT